MIQQEKVPMIKYAMHYGAILGLFWAFKYLFYIGAGFTDHVFMYIYYVLNVGTFFLVYVFYFKYRDSDAEKPKSIVNCILFVATMGFFASVFEGAIMYLHYQVIHPEFFHEKVAAPFLEAVENMQNVGNYPNFEESKQIMYSLIEGKALYIVSAFIGNIITLTFLALIIGLFADKRKVQ